MTTLTHVQRLEAESIHIMREVVAECENPVMLYAIGKDSAAMLHVAMKAFHTGTPAPPEGSSPAIVSTLRTVGDTVRTLGNWPA